jgi:hypothetical protein
MRHTVRRCSIILCLLAAGCAGRGVANNAPPTPPAPRQDDAQATQRMAAAETFCQQLAADPQLAPLRGRILPLDPKVPWTRDMMTIASYVNERERALLVVLDGKRAECRRALIEASPGQAVPFMDYWQRQDDAMVKLYNREIPISSYNRAMASAQTHFSEEVSNQQADRAARANQPPGDGAPNDASAMRAGAVPPLDSFRAFAPR